MANEDDDIKKILRQAEHLRSQRPLRPGARRRFTDELQEMVDRDALKHRSLRDALKNFLALCRDRIDRVCFRVAYWHAQPPMNDEARIHLDDMLAEKKITLDEWRRSRWQRVIRIGDDGVLDVVGPPKRNLLIGKIAVSPLIMATSFGIVMILEEPFNFVNSVGSGLLLGVLLGVSGKAIYDCSWGHQSLATKLRYLCPILRVRMS